MSKLKYPERVLIVLGPDGAMLGAAQYSLTTWDDEDIPDKTGDAEPLDPATLAKVLPAQAAALAQLAVAVEQNRLDAETIKDMSAKLAGAHKAADETAETISSQAETIAATTSERDAARAEAAVLNQQLQDARATVTVVSPPQTMTPTPPAATDVVM